MKMTWGNPALPDMHRSRAGSRVVAQVAEVFETAQKLGITVIRVWAFNDGDTWNALQPRMGHIDERVLGCRLLVLARG